MHECVGVFYPGLGEICLLSICYLISSYKKNKGYNFSVLFLGKSELNGDKEEELLNE